MPIRKDSTGNLEGRSSKRGRFIDQSEDAYEEELSIFTDSPMPESDPPLPPKQVVLEGNYRTPDNSVKSPLDIAVDQADTIKSLEKSANEHTDKGWKYIEKLDSFEKVLSINNNPFIEVKTGATTTGTAHADVESRPTSITIHPEQLGDPIDPDAVDIMQKTIAATNEQLNVNGNDLPSILVVIKNSGSRAHQLQCSPTLNAELLRKFPNAKEEIEDAIKKAKQAALPTSAPALSAKKDQLKP